MLLPELSFFYLLKRIRSPTSVHRRAQSSLAKSVLYMGIVLFFYIFIFFVFKTNKTLARERERGGVQCNQKHKVGIIFPKTRTSSVITTNLFKRRLCACRYVSIKVIFRSLQKLSAAQPNYKRATPQDCYTRYICNGHFGRKD